MEPVANEEHDSASRPRQAPLGPSSTASSNSSGTSPVVEASFSDSYDTRNGIPRSLSPSISSYNRPASSVVPPYWHHARNASRTSQVSRESEPPITLEDHTKDPDSDTSRGLWAKSVVIDDYVVVKGKTATGAYVVWNCKVQTLYGGQMTVRMRYSEFDELRQHLVTSFPHATSALPPLPPKGILFKFRPSFLETRRIGLEYFLNCVLLNPEFAGSPIVKDFLFGRIT